MVPRGDPGPLVHPTPPVPPIFTAFRILTLALEADVYILYDVIIYNYIYIYYLYCLYIYTYIIHTHYDALCIYACICLCVWLKQHDPRTKMNQAAPLLVCIPVASASNYCTIFYLVASLCSWVVFHRFPS